MTEQEWIDKKAQLAGRIAEIEALGDQHKKMSLQPALHSLRRQLAELGETYAP